MRLLNHNPNKYKLPSYPTAGIAPAPKTYQTNAPLVGQMLSRHFTLFPHLLMYMSRTQHS